MSIRNTTNPVCQATPGDFFTSYWKELEEAGWQAVILHSWQHLPDDISSDIDYAVRGPEAGELLRFLADYCKRQGWRLIQIIEHEPGAFFCVCMQARPPHAFLQLDVTWSYRRLGHPLIGADVLFDGCRRPETKPFMVPSPGTEFAYLIAKAAAKGKEFSEIRDRLRELLDEAPGQCREMARLAFGETPGEASGSLEAWETWFPGAACFRAIRKGRRLGPAEFFLYLRRVLHPTGFLLSSGCPQDSPALRQVADALMPAFRKLVIRRKTGPLFRWKLAGSLVRTNLVIEFRHGAPGHPQKTAPETLVAEAIATLAARTDPRIANL